MSNELLSIARVVVLNCTDRVSVIGTHVGSAKQKPERERALSARITDWKMHGLFPRLPFLPNGWNTYLINLLSSSSPFFCSLTSAACIVADPLLWKVI